MRLTVKEVETAIADLNLGYRMTQGTITKKRINKYLVESAEGFVCGADTLGEVMEFVQSRQIEVPEPVNLSDFDGITDAPLGDWWSTCPLTCNIANYQSVEIPLPVIKPEPIAEQLDGSHCVLDSKPWYISANYANEAEGSYWFDWWRTYEYAKRQALGATTAKKHVVIMPEPPQIKEQEVAATIVGLVALVMISIALGFSVKLLYKAIAWGINQIISRRLPTRLFESAVNVTKAALTRLHPKRLTNYYIG